MKFGNKLFEGAGHEVYENPENPYLLMKKPRKKQFTVDRVAEDIELSRERYSRWFTETTVEPNLESGYIMHQGRVEDAEPLRPDHFISEDVNAQVKALLEDNRKSLEADGIGIDFVGLLGSAKCGFSAARKFQNTAVDKFFITPFVRFIDWVKSRNPNFSVPANMLAMWENTETQPEIGNLVVGTRNGKANQLVLVDLSLVRTKDSSIRERVRSAILQKWNRFLLRKFFGLKM